MDGAQIVADDRSRPAAVTQEWVRWGERLVLIPLAAMVVLRIVPELSIHPHLALFLLSEVVGVVLLLLQRRGEWTAGFFPVGVAFIGTGIGLLVAPVGVQLVSDAVSVVLVMAGGVMSLAAKLFLGRSFGLVPANRGVKDTGVYRLVRHPMYAGYMLNQLGFLLVFFSIQNLAIYAATWTCFWLRACEEEKFLLQDPAYRAYAARVRYRLLPGIA
jgi:protein-S-isoprenylcysteine O-methyltransferase Ste14